MLLNSNPNKLTENQLDQIVSYILLGRYSLACFLFLKWRGLEPRLYIPYRTYCRLLKQTKNLHG